MTEEGQYLVDFIYAQRGFALFEFADEAQSDARFFCKVNLREVEHLAAFFYKGGNGGFHKAWCLSG